MQNTTSKTDGELLGEYSQSKSQSAFAELAARHASWIYSCALRLVRDTHLAEDVAQAVFIILADKAPKLPQNITLNAWLFQVTHYAAGHAVRATARRQRHERTAASMVPEISAAETDVNWQEIRPILDDLVARLHHQDRQTILLRFYQQNTMADIGAALNVSEDAAKKRVARAIDKLRNMLRRSGVTIPAVGFATALIAATTHPAPADVLKSCISANASPTSANSLAIARKTIAEMFAAKLKLTVAAVLLAVLIPIAGAGVYLLQKEPDSRPLSLLPTPAIVTSSINDSRESQAALASLQGRWTNLSLMMSGAPAEASYGDSTLVISGSRATLSNSHYSESVTLMNIDTSNSPARIDFMEKGGRISKGIFVVYHDHLKMCWSMVGGIRPAEFATYANDNRRLAEFQRSTTVVAAADKQLMEQLQGIWNSISISTRGGNARASEQHGSFIIAGNKVNEPDSPPAHARVLIVSTSHTPNWIDISSDAGPPTCGILQVQGDRFQMCWTNPGGARPTEFTTSANDGRWLGTFQRQPNQASTKVAASDSPR